MDRRTYLRAITAIGAAATAGLAGCLGSPEAANEYDYETNTENGIAVPLVPVADAGEWFEDTDTLFVDTRRRTAYEDARVADAVWSPAPDGREEGDPLEDVSTDRQIVTYCVCPHTLATIRGESLIAAGYEHTYALDEGLNGWAEAGLPMAGANQSDLHLDSEYHTET